MKLLSSDIFNSRVRNESITRKETWLGYFLGPIGVTLMGGILSSYLNVYYTDVIGIADIWGGMFLSAFPVVCKIIDAFTFIVMGRVVDRTSSCQGKARPWILLSTPILLLSMMLLFMVPEGSDGFKAAWIFISYNLFYSIGYTAYSTSHTLLVPLSTKNDGERSRLSVISNSQNMLSGTFLAILFPCILVPFMGVDRTLWMKTILMVTLACCPLLLMEYYYTRERITMAAAPAKNKQNFRHQLSCCVKSRCWVLIMVYMIISQLFGALSSASVFYYCNWVLGSYNDGFTQALYYGLGNAPLGLGVFLCMPVCRKFGRRRAMMYGFLMAVAGSGLCLFNPYSLSMVLAGQTIKAIGLIPSSYMIGVLLAEALDDVEDQSQERCDGFSSSIFNIIVTVSSGLALCIFNFFLTQLGYVAPTAVAAVPVQNRSIRGFFIFAALGSQIVQYLFLAGIMYMYPKKQENPPINMKGKLKKSDLVNQ